MANFSLIFFLLFTLANPSQSSSAKSFLRTMTRAQSDDGSVPAQRLYCVAKNNADDSALLSALDWACGPGGVDCGSIQQGGPCYDPNDLIGMASYAFNQYCLKNGMTDDACNFSNTAALTSLDPSQDKCKFQSSLSDGGNSSLPSTATGMYPSTADINGHASRKLSRVAFFSTFLLALVTSTQL